MKIIQHTKTKLKLQAKDRQTILTSSIFSILMLAIGCILMYIDRAGIIRLPYSLESKFGIGILLASGGLILLTLGSTLTILELNCQLDRDLNLFQLSYHTCLRQKKIERSLVDLKNVRVNKQEDVDGYIFYHLVIIMKSGEEIAFPSVLNTPRDLDTCSLIATEIRSFLTQQN